MRPSVKIVQISGRAVMTKIISTFALFFLLVSCSTLLPLKPSWQCLPNFPDRDGWYGGDGAYSVQLDEKRTLWLFGDTFVAEDIGRTDRIGMDVIMGNTVAVSTCLSGNEFSIRYFLKKQKGKFVSFFGESEFLWPQDPFIAENVLYIPLLIIQGVPDAPAPFNFKIAGHKIARIKDFSATDPRTWPVDYLDWTSALAPGVEALATTSIVHENYVYFYPLYQYKKDNINISGNILARLPVGKLDHPAKAFEYLNSDGTWDDSLLPQKAKIVLDAAVSELSVRYSAQDGQWLAVYLSPADKGRRLLVQTSQKMEGPWGQPIPLIEPVPEVDPASPLYHKHTFCYAGKEHRQYAQNKNLIVTYVCNSSEDLNQASGFLRNNLFLYRPVVNVKRMP